MIDVEAITESSRETDMKIWDFVSGAVLPSRGCPSYTSNFSDALSLLPDGWTFWLTGEKNYAQVSILNEKRLMAADAQSNNHIISLVKAILAARVIYDR